VRRFLSVDGDAERGVERPEELAALVGRPKELRVLLGGHPVALLEPRAEQILGRLVEEDHAPLLVDEEDGGRQTGREVARED
jgi:hypothetical protein